jgi:hypothetical protein
VVGVKAELAKLDILLLRVFLNQFSGQLGSFSGSQRYPKKMAALLGAADPLASSVSLRMRRL